MKSLFKLYILLILSCFQILFLRPELKAENVNYKVGVVPQFDTRKIQNIWQPILNALSERTNLSFSLYLSKSIPNFEKEFSAGTFDIAYMNPYHLIVANKKQGYLPLIRDVANELFGIIVVRKDSPIQNIQELEGQKIAFPAPNALGAALIPRAEFVNKYKINIMPIYVRSHSSVYLNVILKQVAAGGGVQKTLQQQKAEVRNQLRILYQTQPVAPHPIAVHPRVSEENRERILKAALALGATENGRVMLRRIPINQIGKARLSDYDELKKLGLEEFYIK